MHNINICEIDTNREIIKLDNIFFQSFQNKQSSYLSNTTSKDLVEKSVNTLNQKGKKIAERAESISPMKYATPFHNFEHKIEITQGRFDSIAIGIPTIKRPNSSYLKATLDSLFFAMNADERDSVLIVVLIAEVRCYD